MTEEKNKNSEKVDDCETLKVALKKAEDLNIQYEEAYKELVTRYNKLRVLFDNMVEACLNMKQ